MQFDPTVHFEGFEPTEALRDHVDAQLEKLGRLARSVRRVRVTVSTPHKHGWRPAEFLVSVQIEIPHHRPFVVRARRSADVYGCVREAIEATGRAIASKVARSKRRARRVLVPTEGVHHASAIQ